MLDAGIDVISTVNIQHLESLNDGDRRADRGARARDVPGPCARRGRRGRARRSDARGAAGAPRGRQGLPARTRRGGAAELLPARQPQGAAGAGAPRGRRGRGGPPPYDRARPAQPAGGERARARAGRAAAEVAAHPAPRVAVAQRLGSEIDALWVRPSGRPPSDEERRRSPHCDGSRRPRRRTSSKRKATTSSRRSDASPASAARRTSSSARRTRAAAARSSAARSSRAWCASCPASTSASSRTAPTGTRLEHDRDGDRARRARRASRRGARPPRRPPRRCAGRGAGRGGSSSRSPASSTRPCSRPRSASPMRRTRPSCRRTCLIVPLELAEDSPLQERGRTSPCRCSRRSSRPRCAPASPSTRASRRGVRRRTRSAGSGTSSVSTAIVGAGSDGRQAASARRTWPGSSRTRRAETLVLKPAPAEPTELSDDRAAGGGLTRRRPARGQGTSPHHPLRMTWRARRA